MSACKTLLKKNFDEKNDQNYDELIQDHLGDILWYAIDSADKLDFQIHDILKKNHEKNKARWTKLDDFYDTSFPVQEQFPKKFSVKFEKISKKSDSAVRISVNLSDKVFGKNQFLQIGDVLDDNSVEKDFYRYHDVFHLALVAHLSWSPIIRKLFKRKRKSDPAIDNSEDGARAAILEEAVIATIFEHRKEEDNYEKSVSYDVLKTITYMTKNLEVKNRTFREWEDAIMSGYKIFNLLTANKEGIVTADLKNRTLTFQKIKK